MLLITHPLVPCRELLPFAFVTGVKGVVLFPKAGVLLLLHTMLVLVEGISFLLVAAVKLLRGVVEVVLVVGCVDSHCG